MEYKKIKCPFCGYEMPIFYNEKTVCIGVFVRCKARHCKKTFEIKMNIK